MNEFGKVAGYKINIEISEAFFYINKKKKNLKNFKINLIYNRIKHNKMLRNKFNQGVTDLYTENYKT